MNVPLIDQDSPMNLIYQVLDYGSQDTLSSTSQWLNVKVFKDNGQQDLQTAFLFLILNVERVSLESATEALEQYIKTVYPDCTNRFTTSYSGFSEKLEK